MSALVVAFLVAVLVAPPRPAVRGRAQRLIGPMAGRLADLLRGPGRRVDQHRRTTLLTTIELLARALRSGASPSMAVHTVAAELPESGLDDVARRIAAGVELHRAIDAWAADDTDRRMTAAVIVLGHASGAAMAASLDRAAASIRQRRSLAEELRALSAQARVSALVVGTAPVVFAAVLIGVDRDALVFLATTPEGWAAAGLGLALDGVGWWWMRRITLGVSRWE